MLSSASVLFLAATISLENVMFQYLDVINGLKTLCTALDTPTDLSHCQRLDFQARSLGFQSYHHFRRTMSQLPTDSFAAVSLGLMRRICEKRLPLEPKCRYYEFVPLPHGIGYYSRWIGWDKNGDEVREPRPLNGRDSVQRLRGVVDFPVYVIESVRELTAWQQVWRSTAYLPEELAKRHFAAYFDKQRFVAEKPPMDLVERKARSGRYDSNVMVDNA